MVPIFVAITFIALIVVAWLFEERRAEGIAAREALGVTPAPAPAAATEPASYLHPGHVWVNLMPDGIASVGASDFAANFVGALSGVELPEAGVRLRQGEPAWTLVSSKNRRLTQAMPLDGEIVDVNRDLAKDAGRGGSNGRDAAASWILRVRPSRLAENLRNLFRGSLADAWQELAGARLNAALVPALGRHANDGGVWLTNFGDLLDDSDWHALKEELFPPDRGAAAR